MCKSGLLTNGRWRDCKWLGKQLWKLSLFLMHRMHRNDMLFIKLLAPCRLHFLHAHNVVLFFPSEVELWHMSLDNITQLTIVSGLHHTIQNKEIWRSECDVYCMRPWAIAQTMREHFSSQNTVYRMSQWLSVPFKFPKESLSTFVISKFVIFKFVIKYHSYFANLAREKRMGKT